MDDERIERALRQGPPDEPTYEPGRFAATVGLARPARAGGPRRLWAGLWGALRVTATVLVAGILVAGLVLLRSGNSTTGPSPSAPAVGSDDLLAQVRASGVLRVAVVADYPNVPLAGGAYDGVDIDAAREIARRLGVRAEIVPASVAQLQGGNWHTKWDVVVGMTVTRTAQRALNFGQSYRFQPALVAVQSGLPITAIAGLAGHSLCLGGDVAVGQWLDGTLDVVSVTPAAPPPTGVARTNVASDSACLGPATPPAWDAFVGDRQLSTDFAALPGVRVLSQPAFTEQAAVGADRAGPDAASLLAAIDGDIAAMRADGTLASISKQRFGGIDVTTVP